MLLVVICAQPLADTAAVVTVRCTRRAGLDGYLVARLLRLWTFFPGIWFGTIGAADHRI